MGFEPGTFRSSCVEHSNHYGTEARPIPDVLIVLLVAPKCSVVTLACMRHNRTTIKVSPTPNPHGPYRTLRRQSPQYTSHSFPDQPRMWGTSWFFPHRNPYLLTWRIWGRTFGTYILRPLTGNQSVITGHLRLSSMR